MDFEPTLWLQTPEGAAAKQVLRQVWFPGAHSNVGGGYDEHGLSDIALAWMASQVDPLLALNLEYVHTRQDRKDVWSLGRLYDSAAGPKFVLRPKAARRPFTKQPQSATMEAIHLSAVARAAAGANAVPGAYNLSATGKAAVLDALEEGLRWKQATPVMSLTAAPHGILHAIPADLRKL